MGLIGKEPVDKPCEADSFEDAALKNHARLTHEQDECAAYREEMSREGKPPMEALDPAFWAGAITSNAEAFKIYQDEQAAFLGRVAARLEELGPHLGFSKDASAGWSSIRDNWVKALRKNDPQVIVYW